jgi:hypothetical protein
MPLKKFEKIGNLVKHRGKQAIQEERCYFLMAKKNNEYHDIILSVLLWRSFYKYMVQAALPNFPKVQK